MLEHGMKIVVRINLWHSVLSSVNVILNLNLEIQDIIEGERAPILFPKPSTLES